MLTWIGGTKVLPSNSPPEWKMKLKLLFIPFSPLLHEQYPEAEVESNFDENAIFRCQHMVWDDEKQMIVDLLAPEDNEEIGTEENLSGCCRSIFCEVHQNLMSVWYFEYMF